MEKIEKWIIVAIALLYLSVILFMYAMMNVFGERKGMIIVLMMVFMVVLIYKYYYKGGE